MTLTLLLDLDDTLLTNDINTFVPAYLKALGKHLIEYVAPDHMARQLLAATKVMTENNIPALTLENAFDQAFYPAISRTKEEMRAALEQFYEGTFPALQSITAQRPAAMQMVEWALANSHTTVVATNPIFPRSAILHRLRWAGLDPDQVPFSLIVDYERFHYAKPNPAFVAEILAQLGWPNQPAVMIGNSLEDDLVPAATLGLPVYWVNEQMAALPEGFPPYSASGTVAEIPAWIESVDAAGLRQEFHTPQALLPMLKATPAAFDTFAKGLTERQWRERPGPDEWSLTEIFCHLRDVDEEVNLPRIEKVIAGTVPFLPGVNSDTWAEERNYAQEDGRAALQGYLNARYRLIQRLQSITEADWEQEARHAIFGPTTLKELISFIVTHDRSHIQQSFSAARALEETIPGGNNAATGAETSRTDQSL